MTIIKDIHPKKIEIMHRFDTGYKWQDRKFFWFDMSKPVWTKYTYIQVKLWVSVSSKTNAQVIENDYIKINGHDFFVIDACSPITCQIKEEICLHDFRELNDIIEFIIDTFDTITIEI